MTIRKILKKSIEELEKAQIPNAPLDARILIKHVLGFDETEIIKNMNQIISLRLSKAIEKLVARRAQYEPIAYILGSKEFYGLNFLVNKNVLIPRPESEWLVEESLKSVKSIMSIKSVKSDQNIKRNKKKSLNILDMGTGSGCIIIALDKSLYGLSTLRTFNLFASDISPDALIVAQKNAKNLGVTNINFIESDLFEKIDSSLKFNLIIANLPYVPENDTNDSTKFEPKNAIFAPDNGAEIIKKFSAQAKNFLDNDGLILIELDPRNAKEIKSCAKENFPDATIELTKDLADFDRYLTIQLS